MKKSHLFATVCVIVLSQFSAFAQTSQKGVVKEYREENNKRPLAGVEVEITNAGSVVSDRKGDFLLEFRTFKPGQKVNVRRIEKNGYEVFNKEALEQWNINPDEPFTIVMVKQELFKEIRDNYSRISSKSYAEQYEKEKAALDKERQEGRLSEEKHREELEKLSDWYDAKLDNLDNYIDRFARIDLAELDENERAIIELVKEGKLEEAMARYDEWGLIEIIESELSDLSQIRNAVDDLNTLMAEKEASLKEQWSKFQRELDFRILTGGRKGYDMVSEMLMRAAKAADPNNPYILYRCITYSGYINNIALQKSISELCDIEKIADTDYRILLSQSYSNSLVITGEYEKAIPYAEYVVAAAEQKGNVELKCRGLSHLMSIYEFTMQLDKQNEVFNELVRCCNDDSVYESLSEYYRSVLNQDIASHYDRMGDFLNANKYLIRSYDLQKEIYQSDSNIDNLRRYVNISVSLGTSYYNIGDIDNSIKHLKEVQVLIEDAGMTENPAFIYEYYTSLKQLGVAYFALGNYADSEMLMASALKIIDSVSSDLFIVEEKTDISNNLGYLYFTTGQYDKSEKMYMLALNACYNPYIENPNKYIFHIFRVQINISSLYLAMENYENALSYGKDALVNCEMLYSIYPDFVVNEYALTLQNMAQAAAALGKKEYALEFLAKRAGIALPDFDSGNFRQVPNICMPAGHRRYHARRAMPYR